MSGEGDFVCSNLFEKWKALDFSKCKLNMIMDASLNFESRLTRHTCEFVYIRSFAFYSGGMGGNIS